MTECEILDEHPGLEKEDFAAVYAFAADATDQDIGQQGPSYTELGSN